MNEYISPGKSDQKTHSNSHYKKRNGNQRKNSKVNCMSHSVQSRNCLHIFILDWSEEYTHKILTTIT